MDGSRSGWMGVSGIGWEWVRVSIKFIVRRVGFMYFPDE